VRDPPPPRPPRPVPLTKGNVIWRQGEVERCAPLIQEYKQRHSHVAAGSLLLLISQDTGSFIYNCSVTRIRIRNIKPETFVKLLTNTTRDVNEI
jgi:hypothetical protein